MKAFVDRPWTAVAAMGQSHLWDGPDASRRVWRAGRNVLLLAKLQVRDAVPCEPWSRWRRVPFGRPGASHRLWLARPCGAAVVQCCGAVLTLCLVASRSSPAK
jgi:hypothetical protein